MRLLNQDIYSLKEQKKKIVCFGAGEMFQNFINDFQDMGIANKIVAVLDNNEKKYNTEVTMGEKKINVISVEEFCKNFSVDDYIFLVTCADAVSVYRQLQQIEVLRDVDCYILQFVKGKTNEIDDKNRHYPADFKVSEKPVIPKVIHYCWFGETEIPEQNREWMASWKKYCPDYEIIEWNEKNYDFKKNRFMLEAYQAGKWGFISDYARLDIVYNYGGIYLDTDVEIIKSLDELLYQDAFMGVDGTKRISSGLGFGAKPYFPLLKELMYEYDNRSFYNDEGVMELIPCPKTERCFFNSKGYINNGECQEIDGLIVYPEKVLSGKCVFTGKIEPTEHTFSVHHYDGSWDLGEKKMRRNDLWELYKTLV